MKTIHWGIIGCGNVTEIKSGPAFQKAENSALVAVMRRNGELAKDYAARHSVPKWYSNADDLINDAEVNAIYVATPPESHLEYVLKSAAAGKPVYVEKPMACNSDECERMIDACKKAGVPLFVAYYKRALERFLKVKELVASGAIGEVRFVTVSLYKKPGKEELNNKNLPWRVIPEISGGGLFFDLACHTLDILDFILGPIEKAKGIAANQAKMYEAEDIVTATFSFPGKIQGTGVWCFSSYTDYDINEIVGSKGKISFSTFASKPVLLCNQEGTTEFPIINPVHIQQPMIQTIVNDLNNVGKCTSTGETALRTAWVMDEIIKEYRQEKKSPKTR